MDATTPTDEGLMRAYVHGDEAALRRLFERFAPQIHEMGLKNLRSDAGAQDLVQRSFLELHRARREFTEGDVVHLWMLRISMNLLRDRWRQSPAVIPSARAPAEPAGDFDVDVAFRMLETGIAETRRSPLYRIRELSTGMRTAIVSLVFAAIALILAGTSHPLRVLGEDGWRVTVALLVFGTLFELTLRLALRPPHRPWFRRTTLAGYMLLTLFVSVVVAMFPQASMGTEALLPATPRGWSSGLPCLSIGLIVAIPTYLAARVCDRGGRISRWLAAAASALGANLVLTVTCSIPDEAHRLASHAGLGFLLLGCLGAATLAERWLGGSAAR